MDNGFNIFEGITRNWFFIGINFVMVGGQVMIIFVGGKAFSVTPLTGIQWAISIVLGAISLPVAVVIRLIPDEFLRKIAPQFMTSIRSSPRYKSDTEMGDRFEWNRGIEDIRKELSFLKLVRGGRLNQLKFGQHNIRETMKENFSHMFRGSKAELTASDDGGAAIGGASLTPSSASHRRRRSRANSAIAAAAMVPGVVAGGVGGWSPVERAPSHKDNELLPPASTKSSSSEAHAQQQQQLAPQSTATSATHVEPDGSGPEPPPK